MRTSDLESVLGWRNHPDVRRYMYTQHEISLDEHRKWFSRASQSDETHLLIFEHANIPSAFVNVTQLRKSPVAEWSFHLAPHAARGVGARLGIATLDYSFIELQLHKLCGEALGFNERSIRFHSRLGFRQEGLLKDQYFDGSNYYDVVCFGILSSEWSKRREELA
ncbi:UDP-4-amino-4,6-dideoxy-N-acetyl-beta-L-altrosamine N-acetyltransferase [Endozoicomonas sp. G2_2]|nr:UDP-4-amino-4,6-dideoxy-N-acetyl-beta-L-altrosamine N-acetyltransferase [Endozoicomonas sp. G2_2]